MPSTVIRDYRYDPDRRVLTITFVSGERYAYFDVPGMIYDGMRVAGSRGRFFSERIRDRYRFERLGPGSPPPDAPQPAAPRPSGPVSPPPAGAAR